MHAKLIGGIFLVTGTAIGAGLLALPVATAESGFLPAILLLIVCWAAMTSSAFLILEACLWLPRQTNLISMAGKTLGATGKALTWLLYLLLCYALLAAYIAGGTDLLKNLAASAHITLTTPIAAILFTGGLGCIVWGGIRAVDLSNRSLMSIKLMSFIILIALIAPAIHPSLLTSRHFPTIGNGMTVTLTSFGFAVIIPSLRYYFHNNVRQLRQIILAGSILPLICYLAWISVVMGVIPRHGDHGLITMLHSGQPTSGFLNALEHLLQKNSITNIARLFTSICMLTSFLGVALCMVDFLGDGLRANHHPRYRLWVCALALLPPLSTVLWRPAIFISALQYAGLIVVVLLIVLPVLMVWRGRYYLKLDAGYRVAGGKPLLSLLLLFSAIALYYSI